MTRDAGDTIILEGSAGIGGSATAATCVFHYAPYADVGRVSIQHDAAGNSTCEAFLRFGSGLSIITTHANLAALRELIDAYLLKFASVAQPEGSSDSDHEPPCTCVYVDADLVDASTCEFCNPESAWNRAHPASVAPTPIEESEDVQF